MKTKNRGFTIVELIIVIAVIGVLAAILIPTFASIISKANAKSALSDARNALTDYVTERVENDILPDSIVIFVEKANKYYIYGCTYESEEQLSVVDNNEKGFDYDTLSDLVHDLNCTTEEYNAGIAAISGGATAADTFGDKAFYLYPEGSKSMELSGFIDVSSMMSDLADNVKVFYGVLVNSLYCATPTPVPTVAPPTPTPVPTVTTPTPTPIADEPIVTPAPSATPLATYRHQIQLVLYNFDGSDYYTELPYPSDSTASFYHPCDLTLGINRISIAELLAAGHWPSNFGSTEFQYVQVAKGDETLTPIDYIEVELTDVNTTENIRVNVYTALVPVG